MKKNFLNLKLSLFSKIASVAFVSVALLASCAQENEIQPAVKKTNKHSSARLDNATGTNAGFFYSIYSKGGTVDMTFPQSNLYAGNFQINYSNVEDVVGGKGWKPGGIRKIGYNVGSLTGQYNFVGVYGWTKSPLIEYYVTEKGNIPFKSIRPDGKDTGKSVNNVNADGHTYNFAKHKQIAAPNITGVNADFWQYIDNWGGQTFNGNKSIDMAPHIANWKKNGGQGFGSYDYQVFGLEAFSNKSGSINASVF
jgi:endo-1,4-beta-xylanase